jgi:signal transduction histidine kinase
MIPMRLRLWPQSLLGHTLLGQTLLAVAIALLITQTLSAFLLLSADEQRREAALVNNAAFQLISASRNDRRAAGGGRSDERRDARRDNGRDDLGRRPPILEPRNAGPLIDGGPPRPLPRPIMRRLRYQQSETSPVGSRETRLPDRETALRAILAEQSIATQDIVIVQRALSSDPLVASLIEGRPRLEARLASLPQQLFLASIKREGSDIWETARVPITEPDGRRVPILIAQALLLFAVLMTMLYFILRRITGPLAVLRERTESFSATGEASEPLALRGPKDVADLTKAHNAMEGRITAMLDEKDVMLGAIGHDLKSPLSALRVRVEAVEDEGQRSKMRDTITDITQTLDEILDLARIGRNDTPAEAVELTALAASIVEEFEDMGENVTLADSDRLVASVHLTWLKRGLRNLIGNAVRYAGAAKVSLLREGGETILRVDDDGPGIPADQIAAMLEPFARGEASRNRATGGAGLGLTITRAVAEQHGGVLHLENRPSGGLRAEIRLPITGHISGHITGG